MDDHREMKHLIKHRSQNMCNHYIHQIADRVKEMVEFCLYVDYTSCRDGKFNAVVLLQISSSFTHFLTECLLELYDFD